MTAVDTGLLEVRVKNMYRHVAREPLGTFQFEMGRNLAERLGYPMDRLRGIPSGAIESFAGVGYFFDLADLAAGERVIDLGSGSGMDAFVAAHLIGSSGRVLGVDFTAEQLEKARQLAADGHIENVEFREGRIEDRNCSGGCWSWHPWVALEQPAQGDQRVDAVLARGRYVGTHGQERLRAVQGPPAPGDLLLQLDQADVALGQIIGGWDPQVLQEPHDLA